VLAVSPHDHWLRSWQDSNLRLAVWLEFLHLLLMSLVAREGFSPSTSHLHDGCSHLGWLHATSPRCLHSYSA